MENPRRQQHRDGHDVHEHRGHAGLGELQRGDGDPHADEGTEEDRERQGAPNPLVAQPACVAPDRGADEHEEPHARRGPQAAHQGRRQGRRLPRHAQLGQHVADRGADRADQAAGQAQVDPPPRQVAMVPRAGVVTQHRYGEPPHDHRDPRHRQPVETLPQHGPRQQRGSHRRGGQRQGRAPRPRQHDPLVVERIPDREPEHPAQSQPEVLPQPEALGPQGSRHHDPGQPQQQGARGQPDGIDQHRAAVPSGHAEQRAAERPQDGGRNCEDLTPVTQVGLASS